MILRQVVTIDTESVAATMPEIKLYIAILERAVRDLDDFNPLVVSATINWFRGKVKKSVVSFDTVKAVLNLSGARLTYINTLIEKAIEYGNERLSKRKEGRERPCTLPKRPRMRRD